jgi:DNA-binding FadR family transcriptional regulator
LNKGCIAAANVCRRCALSQEHGVSISTIQQAYQILENLQLITPQPRSGYFVSQRKAQPPVPAMTRPVQRPVDVTQWDEVMMLLDARADKEMISLAARRTLTSRA